MGNKLSRACSSPHPSDEIIQFAIVDSKVLKASAVIYLIVVDMQTGVESGFYVKQDLWLTNALAFFAKHIGAAEQGLEMKVGGRVIQPNGTARKLGLKDNDRLEISRKAPMNAERGFVLVDKDGPEQGNEEQAKTKASLWSKYERKCKVVRDRFGYF